MVEIEIPYNIFIQHVYNMFIQHAHKHVQDGKTVLIIPANQKVWMNQNTFKKAENKKSKKDKVITIQLKSNMTHIQFIQHTFSSYNKIQHENTTWKLQHK